MKKFIKIQEQLYLIASNLGILKTSRSLEIEHILRGYSILDSFVIDNLAIHELSSGILAECLCFYTPRLLGYEEETILEDYHFNRPTKREPIIKGLYATVARNKEYAREAQRKLGDNYLDSKSGVELTELANSCVFSHKNRMITGRLKI